MTSIHTVRLSIGARQRDATLFQKISTPFCSKVLKSTSFQRWAFQQEAYVYLGVNSAQIIREWENVGSTSLSEYSIDCDPYKEAQLFLRAKASDLLNCRLCFYASDRLLFCQNSFYSECLGFYATFFLMFHEYCFCFCFLLFWDSSCYNLWTSCSHKRDSRDGTR